MYVTGPTVGQAQKSQSSSNDNHDLENTPAGLESTFTQLLVAQLRSQDPLSPMDPTTFVSQLVGLNTLDSVTRIYQLLKQNVSPASGKTSG